MKTPVKQNPQRVRAETSTLEQRIRNDDGSVWRRVAGFGVRGAALSGNKARQLQNRRLNMRFKYRRRVPAGTALMFEKLFSGLLRCCHIGGKEETYELSECNGTESQ